MEDPGSSGPGNKRIGQPQLIVGATKAHLTG